jgi:acyl-CoA synthetase (AMP-forming)/AMP-acid ligase II
MANKIDQLPPGIMAITLNPTFDSITLYLAALACRRPLIILASGSSGSSNSWLFDDYQPAIVSGIDDPPMGYLSADGFHYNPGAKKSTTTSLCLTTSGSTGSPKLVRLSYEAVSANAMSIAEALDIGKSSRAITSLPLNYSYGLSVLNSHLVAGGQIVLTADTIMSREFWLTFDSSRCTSFAGVPYSYTILKRLRFVPGDHPTLRVMTQAGGKLDIDSCRYFHQILSESGKQFVIMYGQTEATARMTVLQHSDFETHEKSVGKAIPKGLLKIIGDEFRIQERYVEGEVVYQGPNVMDRYVNSSDDFDEPGNIGGILHTGDRGYLDDEGYLYITGRQKRIGKIHGIRINLDEVEGQLRSNGTSCAVINVDDSIHVFVETNGDEHFTPKSIAERFRLHSSTVKLFEVAELPILSNGKIDYFSLQNLNI